MIDSLMFFLSRDGFRELATRLSPAQDETCFAVAEFVFDDDDGGMFAEECEAAMRFREEFSDHPGTGG